MFVLDSVTGALIEKALDASWMTHRVIAHNVANAGTSGYTALRLDFDNVLDQLSDVKKAASDAPSVRQELSRLDLGDMVESTGEQVVVEREMLSLTRNTLYYQGLITARSAYGEIMKQAISGGR